MAVSPRKLALLAGILLTATVSQSIAESEAAKQLLAKVQNTPAARAGKALSNCLLKEVEKARQANLSKEEFGKILVIACPEETQKARRTLLEALREMTPNKQWNAEDDRSVDFGVSVIRIKAYQDFTGVK